MFVGKSGETFDDALLQQLSDVANDTFEAEIKANSHPTPATPRISSFFNFNSLNLLPTRNLVDSSEDVFDNEIENSDVIEIKVPVIGSEYARFRHDQQPITNKNQLVVNEISDNSKGYAEVGIFTTQPTSDLSTTDGVLTFSVDFQTSSGDTTTSSSVIETTTQTVDAETTSSVGDEIIESTSNANPTEDIQSVESKLIEQWKAADSMTDDFLESELFTLKPRRRPKFPFNVKIIVNNEDEKKSCKSKTSCNQVRVSRSRHDDIDPQFYIDYSDEDLYFQSEPNRYYDGPNELRARNARRANDDMSPFTPAPRFPPIRGLKKPAFVERWENESSFERSERINKNLDGLMKFVAVWAHVDKFVSDRARSAISKLAYITGGDDYDDRILGSKKRNEMSKRTVDDPFT